MEHLNHRLEANPTLGYIASVWALLTGWFSLAMQHADDFAKVFGLFATIFGFAAGYYTMRIQRRTWKKMNVDKQ